MVLGCSWWFLWFICGFWCFLVILGGSLRSFLWFCAFFGGFEGSWWSIVVLCGFWWFLIVLSGSMCFLTALSGSWWFLVLLGGSLGLLVVLGIS